MERIDGPDRGRLGGLGEQILILVAQHASPAQLTDWLKLPLELSAGDPDFLLKPNECCQVRRKGEAVLTVVMERASSKQWFKWLQIPLEHACLSGKAFLVEHLLAAGAGQVDSTEREAAGVGKSPACCSSPSLPTTSPAPRCCRPPPPEETVPAGAAARSPSCCPTTISTSCSPSPLSLSLPASASACCGSRPASSAERPREMAAASCCPSSPSRPCSSPVPPEASGASCHVPCGGREVSGIRTIDVVGAVALVDSDNLCLHRATMACDLNRMRDLLAGGVDRNATDLWSCTALHRAAEQDDAEPVRLLLAAGLDVRARDMEGYSPLHFAAARGAAAAILDLLAAGSCVSDRGLNGDTPLHSAVRFLSLETARILLESDADEGAKNEEGHTPGDVTGVLPDGREIENQPDPLMARGIHALLAAAPAQRKLRIWKRRAWLVMLRARAQAQAALEAQPDALFPVTDDGPKPDEVAVEVSTEKALSCDVSNGDGCGVASDNRAGGVGGKKCCGVDSGLSDLVHVTTGLAEDGVFQKIVGFL